MGEKLLFFFIFLHLLLLNPTPTFFIINTLKNSQKQNNQVKWKEGVWFNTRRSKLTPQSPIHWKQQKPLDRCMEQLKQPKLKVSLNQIWVGQFFFFCGVSCPGYGTKNPEMYGWVQTKCFEKSAQFLRDRKGISTDEGMGEKNCSFFSIPSLGHRGRHRCGKGEVKHVTKVQCSSRITKKEELWGPDMLSSLRRGRNTRKEPINLCMKCWAWSWAKHIWVWP